MDNISFDFEVVSHSLELLSFHLRHAEIVPVYTRPQILFCLFVLKTKVSVCSPTWLQTFSCVPTSSFRNSWGTPEVQSETACVPQVSSQA